LLVKLLLALALIAGGTWLGVQQILGSDVDCMSAEYLGDIEILEARQADPSAEEAARAAANEHALTDGARVQAIRYGLIRSNSAGMEEGIPAFIAVLPNSEVVPAGGPIGVETGEVETPCQVVVLSAEGEVIYSMARTLPIDR
jgi:hypothetical protein